MRRTNPWKQAAAIASVGALTLALAPTRVAAQTPSATTAAARQPGRSTTRYTPASATPIMPRITAQADPFPYNALRPGRAEEQEKQFRAERERLYLDCLKTFAEQKRARGAQENDIADAFAVAVALNYEVFRGGTRLSERQFDQVRSLMRADTLADRLWRFGTNARLQRSDESVGIQSVLIRRDYDEAIAHRNDPPRAFTSTPAQQIENVKQRALANLRAYFSPRSFDAYQLTESGFTLKPEVAAQTKPRPKMPVAKTDPATRFPPAAFLVPAQKARSAAASTRQIAEREQRYNRYLQYYEFQSRELNIPTDDLAVGIANCIGLNHQMYTGAPPLNVPQFQSLVTQIRARIVKDPSLRKNSARDKQAWYENWVIDTEDIEAAYQAAQQGNHKGDLAEARLRAFILVGDRTDIPLGGIRTTKTSVVLPNLTRTQVAALHAETTRITQAILTDHDIAFNIAFNILMSGLRQSGQATVDAIKDYSASREAAAERSRADAAEQARRDKEYRDQQGRNRRP